MQISSGLLDPSFCYFSEITITTCRGEAPQKSELSCPEVKSTSCCAVRAQVGYESLRNFAVAVGGVLGVRSSTPMVLSF